MRPRYAGCAKHAMKYYANHHSPVFRTEAERLDWQACEKALESMDENAQMILLEVYMGRDTFGDNVFDCAKKRGIDQKAVWVVINRFEKRFAQERGLI